MPRGSKPGERRGGRQKGTQNKNTLLRNSALIAAAADPKLSPLEYLLNVMRDQTFPLETRVAAAREALPYFHSKPQESVARQATPGRYGGTSFDGNSGRTGQQSIQIRIVKGGLDSAASEAEPGGPQGDTYEAALRQPLPNPTVGKLTPLEFLLGVMRDPDTPANFRLRIASLLARYLHSKRSTGGPPKIVVDDPTGFSIDPALATELRYAKHRYHFVYITRISQPEHWDREAVALRNRIMEIERGLQCLCPSRYGKDQLKRDEERLRELDRVRRSGLKLSKHEDVEEAWLTARVASWHQVPEWTARARLRELDARRWDPWKRRPPLTPRESAEHRALQTLYADHEPDMTALGFSSDRKAREAYMASVFAKYPPVEEAVNPGSQRAS
jgi:hypothetical protein